MRSRAIAAFMLVALASRGMAQDKPAKPRPEIGFRGGIVNGQVGFSSAKSTIINFPGNLIAGADGMHYAFFVTPGVALEPQLGFLRISEGGDSFSLMLLAAQANLFLTPNPTRAPYAFVNVATLRENDSGGFADEPRNGIGGGVGFRRVYGGSVSMRLEGRWRAWSGGGGPTADELSLVIAIGAVFRKDQP